MTNQVIAAFFDSRSDADMAINELVAAGIPRSQIRVMPETDEDMSSSSGTSSTMSSSSTTTGARSGYDTRSDEKGFWASLGDLFLPDEDRYTYAEAMNRGSIMVSVTVDSAQSETAEDILEQYGTVDIEERETSWRDEGWSGYSGGGAGSAAGTTGGMATGYGAGSAERSMNPDMLHSTGEERTERPTGTHTDDDVIPIVEEQLRVGKRQVNQGRVRVRSYVVETPVEEQVNLRREHVHVERRPATGAVDMNADALFRERTIEAEERGEEAIMSKEARVTEELVVRKDVEDETRTVKDSVRRTEVEIDDDRTERTVSGTGTSDPLKRR